MMVPMGKSTLLVGEKRIIITNGVSKSLDGALLYTQYDYIFGLPDKSLNFFR